MSFAKLKDFNSFHMMHRFAKNLSFFCKQFKLWNAPNHLIDKSISEQLWILKQDMRASKILKNSRLNRIFNSLKFFKEANWYMKLSIHFIDWISITKNWVFQASCLSFEVLKLINSIHRLKQFAKRIRFSIFEVVS